MTYKDFDIEAAMRGEPIVCRDGSPAKFGGCNQDAPEFAQIAAWTLVRVNNVWHLHAFYLTGKFYVCGGEENRLDLFMAPKKRELWARAAILHVPMKIEIFRESAASGFSRNTYAWLDSGESGKWLGPAVKIAEWEE